MDRVQEYQDKHPNESSSSSSASSSEEVEEVQWQWQSENGWVDYDDQTNTIIEKAHKQKQPKVSLVHGFFGAQGGYEIDFTNNCQTKLMTGYRRDIRRQTTKTQNDSDSSNDDDAPVWEWQGDYTWHAYDQQTTDMIEKAHKAGQVCFEFVCQAQYKLNSGLSPNQTTSFR